ncbi:dolichol-phosphate mannosyltransferase [Saccharothrix saharensis]|uniref:Dolichol-phosphate mannosyltransferase n=1 Tax=Saccharothrix saharensis TaxID=571190 RepID=A0A543J8L9_9PSEU|nr:glycosyltransferase family 2 protein [Saccharothrix saharensis]TQM79162.1 dolichol-phosphate mannosyltransferase [Saccharothrix saharensis]
MTPAGRPAGRQSIAYVFPVYNEAGNVELLHRTVCQVTDVLADRYDFTFVYVDDGSTDDSATRLQALADADHRVTVIELARNFGHQTAVTAGLDLVDADAVIVMDSDLQDPPRVSLELIAKWRQGYEVVYAQRRSRRDTTFKRVTASAFYWVLRKIASVDIPRDTGDFRLLDRKVVDELRKFRERDRFLRGLVSYIGFRQTGVLFDRDERHAGTTGYPLGKMLRLAANGLLGFSVTPLRLISRLGYGISLLSFLGILYTVGVKVLAPETAVPGWAFTAIAMFFLSGVQITMQGVLGSYIGRTYAEAQGRPLYTVSSVRTGLHQRTPVQAAPDRSAEPGDRSLNR